MPNRTLESLDAAALLFDMDGTLVDSTAVVEAVWRGFAEEHGLDSAEVLDHAHGRQTIDTLARFLPDASDTERRELAATLETSEAEEAEAVVAIAGAAALTARLARLGAPWAVVTSAGRALATRRLHGAGIAEPPVLVAAEDVERGKPAPDGYRDAAEALGVDVAACVVLEDAEAGLQAAIASRGVPVVVGAHASATTEGLLRVPDLRSIAVEPDGDRWRVDVLGR